MSYSQSLLYEPLRSIDSATFTGSYQALGIPLAHSASIVRLVNESTVTVTISTDGINDMDIAPASGFFLYDITTNTPPQGNGGIFIAQGTQYLIKGTASTGLVYLVVQYLRVL
jgi:hypothetical protein